MIRIDHGERPFDILPRDHRSDLAMSMNKRNRDRLLKLAVRLDRWALRIRRYCRDNTPKRPRKAAV
jgi:hypothetical protein